MLRSFPQSNGGGQLQENETNSNNQGVFGRSLTPVVSNVVPNGAGIVLSEVDCNLLRSRQLQEGAKSPGKAHLRLAADSTN